jgi:hypothetical protein
VPPSTPRKHTRRAMRISANQEAVMHGWRKEEEAEMGIVRATHLARPAGRKELAAAACEGQDTVRPSGGRACVMPREKVRRGAASGEEGGAASRVSPGRTEGCYFYTA